MALKTVQSLLTFACASHRWRLAESPPFQPLPFPVPCHSRARFHVTAVGAEEHPGIGERDRTNHNL